MNTFKRAPDAAASSLRRRHLFRGVALSASHWSVVDFFKVKVVLFADIVRPGGLEPARGANRSFHAGRAPKRLQLCVRELNLRSCHLPS